MYQKYTRRSFMKSTAAATGATLAMGTPSFAQTAAPSDTIRVGCIGVGNRGSQLLQQFMQNPDVTITALCDVYEPYLTRDRSTVDPRMIELLGGLVPQMGEDLGDVKRYKDFRKMLDDKNVDAVVIATPDHWHALQTVAALDAGKDVYVEKPLTITIQEGRKMVDAAAKTDRIVQVGLNRRGCKIYTECANMVSEGKIGKVSIARAYRISNMCPNGIGNEKAVDTPKGLDWDMWIGPRPYRPFQYNTAPYFFRWWKQYSTQMGNWGVHYLDAIRWMIGETAPVSISAHGGKFFLTDDRSIPDTMEVTFEFASGAIAIFGVYEANGGSMALSGEVELRGTKGNLSVSEQEYKIFPSGAGQFQDRGNLMEGE
ncbi:Gfo/Idh/MocA family oxidoreductase, partial [candidate division KSB1 bacterium]|nr:Gfo/Idh/MocA family oxidoreductase [candidate division KSB1 bacterium]